MTAPSDKDTTDPMSCSNVQVLSNNRSITLHEGHSLLTGSCTLQEKLCEVNALNYNSRSKSVESKPAKTRVNVCFRPILSC